MGNYASTSDLIDRFASDAEVLHVVDNAAGAIGDATTLARLNDAIEDAEGEVDSYLARRWDVPVDVSGDTQLAAVLKRKTLDIGQYFLIARSDHVTEAAQKVYDGALAWLKDVAKGVAYLPGASPPSSTAASSPVVVYGDNDASSSSSERIFTRSNQDDL